MTNLTVEYLNQIRDKALNELEELSSMSALEKWRVNYIGRKGRLSEALRGVKDVAIEDRGAIGKIANQIKQEVTQAYQDKLDGIDSDPVVEKSNNKAKPAQPLPPGHIHPIAAATRRARNIFSSMGFTIVEGPDVDEQRYNFDLLNIPADHPARAESDTFYINNLPDLVLRTHVSTMQNRGVLENDLKPPFKMMYYGPSYRSEKEDATHFSHFDQYEIMIVDEQVNLADLKGIVDTFYSLFFGTNFEIRFRPAYYPFVEPGFDVDLRDTVTGKGDWLEMCGAGTVHPNVLRNINIDPEKYQGVALGGGMDRLVMLKHGIPDGRALRENDIRFLRQF